MATNARAANNLTKGRGCCLLLVVRDENYQCHQTAVSANQRERTLLDALAYNCWQCGIEVLTGTFDFAKPAIVTGNRGFFVLKSHGKERNEYKL